MYRDRLARQAVTAALQLRRQVGRRLDEPVCPFDIAEQLGIRVQFEPLPSMEGMYSPDGPTIVIGSLRPRGRRAFTCAHELGHHVFGHGLRVDEVVPDGATRQRRDDAEYSADRFASAFLMPKIAVERAFAMRGWDPARPEPSQVYVVAGVLGVGYSTLIGYLEHVLRLLRRSDAERLRRRALPKIREEILGFRPPHDILVVDDLWLGRDADVELGDLVALPAGVELNHDRCFSLTTANGFSLASATAPGVATASVGSWSIACRVARRAYRGRNAYRHLEDPEHAA